VRWREARDRSEDSIVQREKAKRSLVTARFNIFEVAPLSMSALMIADLPLNDRFTIITRGRVNIELNSDEETGTGELVGEEVTCRLSFPSK